MSFKDTSSLSTSVMHLLHRAGQVADEYFAEEMKNSDLTPRQYAVLAILSERETASQTDIVNATGIDRSTLADIVKRLVQRGLLARRRSRLDARAYVVRLTPQGEALLKTAQPAADRVSERMMRALASSERGELITALSHLVETAQRAPSEEPANQASSQE